jgi:hypothetical protein
MCIVCKLGSGLTSDLLDEKLTEILREVRKNPIIPVTLRCNVDSLYRYQNPGRSEDTPGGDLFNDKRDLDIIQKLGLVPGATRPALEIFGRLFRSITTTQGICWYNKITSPTWKGCAQASSGDYEKGHAKGIEAVISPRSEDEKDRAKKQSSKAMYKAEILMIRPHHLMCITCFHGGKEEIHPIKEDNLFEAIDIMQKNPVIPVTLVPGCCMICPPCSEYNAEIGLCIGTSGMGLRDQKKDLDVLQNLGLEYSSTMPARQLYNLLFKKIQSTRQICGYNDGTVRGPEWSICGDPEGSEAYRKGREKGLGIRGVSIKQEGELL